MNLVKRILLSLFAVLVLLAIALFVYLQSLKPQLSGEQTLPGLQQPVEVLFDTYGVPHIYAQTMEDAYYALGYVHAQDRLFQMEMLRRAAAGRLAEILGEELLPVDKFFRTLGLNHFAKEHAAKFLSADSADYQRAAHAYQRGINQYIKTGKTPIEFTIMGIPKTEFTPEDIYLAVGFMSFGFAEGFHADPVLEKIKSEWGEKYLAPLAVQTPPDAVQIKNYNGTVKTHSGDKLIASIHQAIDKIPVPLWQGSNGWVVSAEKSASGYPILANDTHIGFSQPAVWYEAHLEYPGFSFYGHHLAGIPVGLLGNNRFCGFGLTMFENDDVDFFLEKSNPENKNQVMYMGTWENLNVREENILVKGSRDVAFEVRKSRHGPIINGIVENTPEEGEPIALSWLLLQVENHALQAAWKLNHASTFEEAREAVSLFSAPGLNVMYADTDKNIAWWAAAKLPVRPDHVVSKLFLNGESGRDEYTGFYDFSKNPQAVNPPWGFVYSANNQPEAVDGVLYPGYYYPKGRAGRIVELLSSDKKFSAEQLSALQLDVTSSMHVEVAKEIASVLSTLNKPAFEILIKELNAWDGSHQATQVAPAIYNNLLDQIMHAAMLDELGETALASLLKTSVPKNSYHLFIASAANPWWDDVTTKDKTEGREEIVEQAAHRTIELLKKSCGEKPESWTWGKIHTLTHVHALGVVKPLDKFFNVGPFVVDGGSEVINNLHYKLENSGYFNVDGGPALRKVTDFGDIENGITISPTGQSGNVMSPHYSNQAEMFATGKTRKMTMNREEIISQSKNRLVLNPAD
ncbi:MAG: penicillin acylase family protein [Flammeovirgaceae bacterium]|nr:MAG: penicillin acylase family protein [Flammeovirgaceae bacterium]